MSWKTGHCCVEVKLKTSPRARNDVFSWVVLSKMLLPAIVLILTHGTVAVDSYQNC